MQRSHRTVFALVVAGLLLLLLEAASWIVVPRLAGVVRIPAGPAQLEEYLGRGVDPDIGWYPHPAGEPGRVAPRPGGAGPAEASPCVQLVGDSFVYGAEVPDEAAWPHLLEGLLGCPVANYGAVGYGTDQAFLLYQRKVPHRSGVAVLGHQSENIVRLLTRDRGLIYEPGIWTKARFVANARGEVELLPAPTLRVSDYEAYVDDPGGFLGDDPLLAPRTDFRKPAPGIPRAWTLLRAALHPRLVGRLVGIFVDVEPWWAGCYAPDHPDQGVRILTDVAARFVREAEARGQTPLVLLIPSSTDFYWQRRSGRWTYQSLTDRLAAAEIPVLDAGPELLAGAGHRDPCDFFCTRPRTRAGHYSAAGNRLLAEVVARHLRGLVEATR